MNHPLSLPMKHQRTVKGRMQVLSGVLRLHETQARLLLMFNGFTPTQYLIQLASSHTSQASQLIAQLEQQGLIEQVE